jgi:23S rRNA (cytidine1920-2'-O)/16S rRNA (cytidine1409-2'-O)-methyltransferase
MGSRPRTRNVVAHVRALRPDIVDPIAAIQQRRLLVGGVVVLNASANVWSDAGIVLRPTPILRGSVKLEAALDGFDVEVDDAVCLDLGAAAGGFTTVLIRRGARLVYALDAGVGQLRGELRADPRVVNLERTNLADVQRVIPSDPQIEVVTADLSYLSLSDALPQLSGVGLAPAAQLVGLVKPMFELHLDRPPVDQLSLRAAVETAQRGAAAASWHNVAWMASPVDGANGAREFFIHAVRDAW